MGHKSKGHSFVRTPLAVDKIQFLISLLFIIFTVLQINAISVSPYRCEQTPKKHEHPASAPLPAPGSLVAEQFDGVFME